MSLDLSALTPNDAVAALRSYPRRFRSALAPIDDDESIEETAHQMGPDGRSAVEIAADASRSWTVLLQGLRTAARGGSGPLHRGVLDAGERTFDAPVNESVASVLDQIDDGAEALAAEITSIDRYVWQHEVPVTGGGSVKAMDLVREAVRVGHDDLVAMERTLAAVRP